MLAKVWKKALMAICIIACIYNVMNKLVSRTSLEVQLKSVVTQTGVTDIFEKDSENNTISEESQSASSVVEEIQESDNSTTESVEESDDTVVVIY